jgi:hypothetical protein
MPQRCPACADGLAGSDETEGVEVFFRGLVERGTRHDGFPLAALVLEALERFLHGVAEVGRCAVAEGQLDVQVR